MVKKIVSPLLGLALVLCSFWARAEEPIPAEAYHPKSISVQDLYDEAVLYREKGELLKAADLYRTILNAHPDLADFNVIQKELDSLNLKMITTPYPGPQSVEYTILSGDTLGKIAKKFSTTVELIKMRSRLNSDQIRAGEKISVWTEPFNILIDKAHNKLFLKNAETVVKVYDVSTGKQETTTPTGEFTITSRYTDPVWFHRGVVVPPGTPKNFLGTRWLGFDKPGYGIHGTIEPQLIGKSVSGGCVRMRNEDVEEIYNLIPTGTKVVITE